MCIYQNRQESVRELEKKRKGGAEKLRGKNRQALQTDTTKCCKITQMFSAAAGSSSAAMADESGDAGGTGEEDK